MAVAVGGGGDGLFAEPAGEFDAAGGEEGGVDPVEAEGVGGVEDGVAGGGGGAAEFGGGG